MSLTPASVWPCFPFLTHSFFTFLDYIKLLAVVGPLSIQFLMPEALAWRPAPPQLPLGRLPIYSLTHLFLIPSYHLLQHLSVVLFCLLQ